MKHRICRDLCVLLALSGGGACTDNVGTVSIQLVEPPARFAKPLANVRRLTLRVERDGRIVKERTFARSDEFALGDVGPISNAYVVVEAQTSAGETKRGKAGPVDLGASKGGKPMVVNLFLGDVESFSPFAEISWARAFHATVPLPGGDVLITGGEVVESVAGETAMRTVDTNVYELLGAQSLEIVALQARFGFSPAARSQHTATVLPDGRVVLIGGANKQPQQTNPSYGTLRGDVEIFDPREDLARLEPGPNLAFPRRQHTATLLNDGTVLVAGGFVGVRGGDFPGKVAPYEEDAGELIGAAEMLDLSSMTTSALTENGMRCARAAHTATYVPGVNLVVLAGGVGTDGRPSDCVELYDPEQRLFEPAVMTPLDGRSEWVGRTGMAATWMPSIERLAFFGGDRWVRASDGSDTGSMQPVNTIDLVAFDPASRRIAGFERVLIPDRIGEEDVDMPARAFMKPIGLRDGRILLVGGRGFNRKFQGDRSAVDWMTFAPESREISFSFKRYTESRMYGHTVEMLPNGEVILVGGVVSTITNREGVTTVAALSPYVEWFTPKE